jgi:hypothetical protein
VDDYPANSYKSRAPKPVEEPKEKPVEEKRVEKIVEGEVVRRKKPLGRRFIETFFSGDAHGVFSYVIVDVLLPAAKDTVADAVSQGFERLLFGEVRSTSRRTGTRPSGSSGFVSYNRYSTQTPSRREDPRGREISQRARAAHDFDEIILATRSEAEEVVGRLFDVVARYEAATVADLYELLGLTAKFTDDKWGWTDLRGAGVTRVRNGYLLDLPRPEPLD